MFCSVVGPTDTMNLTFVPWKLIPWNEVMALATLCFTTPMARALFRVSLTLVFLLVEKSTSGGLLQLGGY